jgi:hypothetical protein
VRALACEICKQAVHEIDHDDAVADEAEAYRDAFAEATEQPLRSSRPQRRAALLAENAG